jgi:hypothetical protein
VADDRQQPVAADPVDPAAAGFVAAMVAHGHSDCLPALAVRMPTIAQAIAAGGGLEAIKARRVAVEQREARGEALPLSPAGQAMLSALIKAGQRQRMRGRLRICKPERSRLAQPARSRERRCSGSRGSAPRRMPCRSGPDDAGGDPDPAGGIEARYPSARRGRP